jgi:hypothetical protein
MLWVAGPFHTINQGRLQCFDVVWQDFNTSFHEADGITKSAILRRLFSAPQSFF